MKHQESCACGEFALWYADLAGVDAARFDELVCECGHPTREHVIGVGRCLGVVEVVS